MAPHKPVKTYQRKTRLSTKTSTQSVDAFNALLAENLTKRLRYRKKEKLKLKELPPRQETYLTDDSLKLEPNNTFDKILKGKIYNKVKVCNFVKINSSSESSKSKSRVNVTYHSPVMTRRRKKNSVIITEASDKEKSSFDKPITSSLSIEKEKNNKTNITSLSYIKLPKITENQVLNLPVFSETFRERQTVHSSTPFSTVCKKIVSDPISPITKSDSSTSSKLIEKSYDEIRKWDDSFPNLEETTPKRCSLRSNAKRKLSIKSDWKLKTQPRVYLRKFDIKNTNFKGFNKKEQSSSSGESNRVNLWLSKMDLDCSKSIEIFRKNSDDLIGFNEEEQKNSMERSMSIKYDVEEISLSIRKTSFNKVTPLRKSSRRLRSTPKKKTIALFTPKTGKRDPKKKNNSKPFVNVKRRKKLTQNRKSKIKNVTAEILSENEMSYTSSEFSSDMSKVNSTSEKIQVILPKIEETNRIIVDLNTFENFTQTYQENEPKKITVNVPKPITKKVSPSIISLSDESITQDSKIALSQNNSSKSLISPSKPSKIIILSDITLGFNNKIDLNTSLKDVSHDHSYAASPILKPEFNKLEQDVSFLSDIIESSTIETEKKILKTKPKSIKIKPGKPYRRSLSLLRKSSILVDVQNSELCAEDCVCLKCIFKEKLNNLSRRSSFIVPASKKSVSNSLLENYARHSTCYVQEEDKFIDHLDESVRNLTLNARGGSLQAFVTAKDLVLRRCCQTEVLPFEECYPTSSLQNCQKIGEGVYGEVFLYRNQNGGTSVMKIIPIEGELIVNGERQKKFEEILTEIEIAMELSNLRSNKKNTTGSFSEVQRIRCAQGNYPDRLVDLWDLYDETKGSENDSPQMFSPNQLYIILELANGGKDLESFIFNNAMQAYAMFKQTACALAVAENQLKFEHRDLHWGNILLNGVDKNKTLNFRLNGKEIQVDTNGIEIAIIDFTLSRIEAQGVVIFNDLSRDDELFIAKGDYQFEIYRLMQKSNGNEWRHFEPYTNILWLHYILDKTPELRYKNPRTKIHKEYLAKLKKMKEEVLSYNSVIDFVKDKFF